MNRTIHCLPILPIANPDDPNHNPKASKGSTNFRTEYQRADMEAKLSNSSSLKYGENRTRTSPRPASSGSVNSGTLDDRRRPNHCLLLDVASNLKCTSTGGCHSILILYIVLRELLHEARIYNLQCTNQDSSDPSCVICEPVTRNDDIKARP